MAYRLRSGAFIGDTPVWVSGGGPRDAFEGAGQFGTQKYDYDVLGQKYDPALGGYSKGLRPGSVLDDSRDWKTTWLSVIGRGQGGPFFNPGQLGIGDSHEISDKHGMHQSDYHKLWGRRKYTTGQRQTSQYNPQTNKKGVAWEIIDWHAYDRDPRYKKWLTEQGKERFMTLDDITAAEDWMTGASDRRYQNELDELKAQLEMEKLKNEEWKKDTQPQTIDTGGAEAPVGGIWDSPTGQQQLAQMQQWQDQMAAQQYAQQAQMDAWNQQMGGWGNQMQGWGGQMGGWGNQMNQYGDQVQGWGDRQNAWLNRMEQQKISQMFGPRQGAYGVHSGKALQPWANRSWGPRGSFNRQGMRISNLNI